MEKSPFSTLRRWRLGEIGAAEIVCSGVLASRMTLPLFSGAPVAISKSVLAYQYLETERIGSSYGIGQLKRYSAL